MSSQTANNNPASPSAAGSPISEIHIKSPDLHPIFCLSAVAVSNIQQTKQNKAFFLLRNNQTRKHVDMQI